MGVEPTTCRLRIGCSTTELPRPLIINDLFPSLALAYNLRFTSVVLSWFLRGVTSLLNGKCTNRSKPSCALLTGDGYSSASETLTLFLTCSRESDRAPDKKDSKLILTLSDSVRKVLILLLLASSMAFNCRWPEKTSTTKRGDPDNYILTATINIY